MKDRNPRKKDSNLIYKMKLMIEDQVKGFEFSSYGFKSSFGVKFIFFKEDLNLRIMDPPFADAFNA